MGLASYLFRCTPGLSILILLLLSECALHIIETGLIGLYYPQLLTRRRYSTAAQVVFCTYSLFLHGLSFAFSLRLSRAAWKAFRAIQHHHHPAGDDDHSIPMREKEDIVTPGENNGAHGEPIMVMLIPSYKEEQYVLEETLEVLGCHGLAKTSFDVRRDGTPSQWQSGADT